MLDRRDSSALTDDKPTFHPVKLLSYIYKQHVVGENK